MGILMLRPVLFVLRAPNALTKLKLRHHVVLGSSVLQEMAFVHLVPPVSPATLRLKHLWLVRLGLIQLAIPRVV